MLIENGFVNPPGMEENKGFIELLEIRTRNCAQHRDVGADENRAGEEELPL